MHKPTQLNRIQYAFSECWSEKANPILPHAYEDGATYQPRSTPLPPYPVASTILSFMTKKDAFNLFTCSKGTLLLVWPCARTGARWEHLDSLYYVMNTSFSYFYHTSIPLPLPSSAIHPMPIWMKQMQWKRVKSKSTWSAPSRWVSILCLNNLQIPFDLMENILQCYSPRKWKSPISDATDKTISILPTPRRPLPSAHPRTFIQWADGSK